MKELEVCSWCSEKQKELHKHSYYLSPFNSNPYEFGVCDECNEQIENDGFEDVSLCEGCCREIADNSGMRINMRYVREAEGFYCVQCLQQKWFEKGMDNFKEADFFDYSELEKNGFKRRNTYFCRSKESYQEVEKEFNKLQESGLKVIVDIIASGLGLEHHIGLWIK